MPSPVVPVPGVGQVGQGLQNTWGLEEEDEEEDENSGGEQDEAVTRMDEEHEKEESRGGYCFFYKLSSRSDATVRNHI